MSKTILRSFADLSDAMPGESVTEDRDPVADETQALMADRNAKQAPRVFSVAPTPAVAALLADAEAAEQSASDIDEIASLISPLAAHFEHEIEGFFTDRICTNLIKLGADRAAWITDRLIPQVVDEMKTLRRGPNGEIDSLRLDTKIRYLNRLEREAELWNVFSKAARKAFHQATGKEFIDQPRGKAVPRQDAAAQQLDAVLARYSRK